MSTHIDIHFSFEREWSTLFCGSVLMFMPLFTDGWVGWLHTFAVTNYAAANTLSPLSFYPSASVLKDKLLEVE